VVKDLRQIVEVDLVASDHHVLARPASYDLRRDGLVHGAQVRREHLVGGGTHREGQAGAARVEVGQHRELRALHALADEHRAPARLALELDHQRGQLVRGVDLLRDHDDLLGPAALDQVEVRGKVLSHRSLLHVVWITAAA